MFRTKKWGCPLCHLGGQLLPADPEPWAACLHVRGVLLPPGDIHILVHLPLFYAVFCWFSVLVMCFFFTVLFLVAHDVQWPLEAFDRDEQPNVPQVLLSAMQRSDPALQGSGTFFICIFFFFFEEKCFPSGFYFCFFRRLFFVFTFFFLLGR